MQVTLYVESGCESCERSLAILEDVAHERPEVSTEVINIERLAELPEQVIAVPAYLIDGRLVSLGNPTTEHLISLMDEAEVSKWC